MQFHGQAERLLFDPRKPVAALERPKSPSPLPGGKTDLKPPVKSAPPMRATKRMLFIQKKIAEKKKYKQVRGKTYQ